MPQQPKFYTECKSFNNLKEDQQRNIPVKFVEIGQVEW